MGRGAKLPRRAGELRSVSTLALCTGRKDRLPLLKLFAIIITHFLHFLKTYVAYSRLKSSSYSL